MNCHFWNESRKVKYTIGRVLETFGKKTNIIKWERKYIILKLVNRNLKITFQIFIAINLYLKLIDAISQFYKMIWKRRCILKFYKSKKFNPIFIFKEGIELIGECELDDGKDFKNRDEKELLIKLKFGRTFIDVKSIHLKCGKNISKKFYFTLVF